MSNEQNSSNNARGGEKKRPREGSSQTDEEDATEDTSTRDATISARLSSIEDKINLLLTVLPELESYKSRINQLEEENKSLRKSLENAQEEIEDLKTSANSKNSALTKSE